MKNILLDRYGDAQVPDGYELIDDEVQFLAIADYRGQRVIRGASLCEWAEVFYSGRGIEFDNTLSPSRELSDTIPALTAQQIADILNRLSTEYFDLPRPLSIYTLVEALYPAPWWQATLSEEHAAEWLVWLEQQDLNKTDQVLVNLVADQWEQQASGDLAILYQARDRDRAHQLLCAWVGITGDWPCKDVSLFPLEISQEWQKSASEMWRMGLAETQGAILYELLERDLPPSLRPILADAAYDYFRVNPHNLKERWLKSLSPHLSHSQHGQLRRLLPPPAPLDLPEEPGQVLAWFEEQYLPFREWQRENNDQCALARVLELADQFARWYLTFYPLALIKSSHYLGMVRTATLTQHAQSTLLLIVMDGLHQLDAQYTLNKLSTKTSRLTARDQRLLFAPLPTITQFAKEALLKGVWPVHCPKTPLIGRDISESKSPVKLLEKAQSGDVFIWRIQEPDHTYHAKNYSETLEREVEGQLETVAQKIADVVDAVSPNIRLQIVITTDHGRLLGTSQRCVSAPSGMQAHGRAAWGVSGVDFPADGFIINNNLAFLYGERFGLPEDTAIILDENAFYTNDGKQGQECYAHGGLFPEEVIIPWIVLARDSAPQRQNEVPQLRISASGQGVALQKGTITIRVVNSHDIPLMLRNVTIQCGSNCKPVSYCLDITIPELTSLEQPVELEPWPGKENAQEASASAEFCWPYGDCIQVPMAITLQSEELYSRDTTLLDGLDL